MIRNLRPYTVSLVVVTVLLLIIRSIDADDWPQWRGPNRDNVSKETGLLQQWPEGGPPLLWKARGVVDGIASVSIAGGRIFILGHHEDHEYIVVLEETSGEHLWTAPLGPGFRQHRLMRWLSQRAPTIDGERVFAFTATGQLVCLRCRDGKELWRKDYIKDFDGKRGVWGYCDFPLVDGEKLICAPGGSRAAVVALNKVTGETIWETHVPKGVASAHAATLAVTLKDQQQYVVFLQNGLIGVSATEGNILWQNDRFATRQNSFTPLLRDHQIFCASARQVEGVALLELQASADGTVVTERYYRQKLNLNNFQDCLVRVGEHVYGDSRYGPVCLEWKTGEPTWERRSGGRQMNAILYADGHLYVRQADGLMTLVEANPNEYVEKGSFLIPDHEQSIGATHPVIASGRLYLRDNNNLFCYDVRRDAFKRPNREPREIAVPAPAAGTDHSAESTLRSVFVSTPQDVVEKMLETAAVKKSNVIYDLGSGDGRIVIAAAKKHGCRAVGYEIDPELVKLSRENAVKAGVERLVTIEQTDVFTLDLSPADMIAVYLLPKQLEKLIPQLKKLKPGSRIVSHQFQIPGVKPDKTIEVKSAEDGDGHTIHLWTAPLVTSQ